MCHRDTGTSLLDEFFKDTLAEIPKNGAWCLIGVLRQGSFYLRVNVACNHEEVRETIVVKIDDASPPADVASFNSQM